MSNGTAVRNRPAGGNRNLVIRRVLLEEQPELTGRLIEVRRRAYEPDPIRKGMVNQLGIGDYYESIGSNWPSLEGGVDLVAERPDGAFVGVGTYLSATEHPWWPANLASAGNVAALPRTPETGSAGRALMAAMHALAVGEGRDGMGVTTFRYDHSPAERMYRDLGYEETDARPVGDKPHLKTRLADYVFDFANRGIEPGHIDEASGVVLLSKP